jgi:hypothetical protein
VKTKRWKNPILAFVDEKCTIFDDRNITREHKMVHKVRYDGVKHLGIREID